MTNVDRPAARGMPRTARDSRKDARRLAPALDAAARDGRGRLHRADTALDGRSRRRRGARLLRGVGFAILFSLPLWALIALMIWLA